MIQEDGLRTFLSSLLKFICCENEAQEEGNQRGRDLRPGGGRNVDLTVDVDFTQICIHKSVNVIFSFFFLLLSCVLFLLEGPRQTKLVAFEFFSFFFFEKYQL